MIRVDLHLHTTYSRDSATPLSVVIDRCQRRGINCLAVTDHNTISGALELQRHAPFQVIVGEEINTLDGEIIGLFLTAEIPRGLSGRETAARIHRQGGLVCIPHPFDRVRRRRITEQALYDLIPQIDILEAFNPRTTLLRDSERALSFGRAHGLALGAGSDAHTPVEIGGAYVEMREFKDPQDFLEAVKGGQVAGRRANPLVHLPTRVTRLLKALRRRDE